MDPPPASLHSSNPPEEMDAPSTSFATTWDSPVTAHLAPSNLPLNKVQRAWDRRPQSPFSRKKLRFGKVWKRNPAPSANATGMFGSAHALETIGGESPMKAVKKMRMDYGEVVNSWDGRGSPRNRRIVTRSNRAKELVALDEDEPQEQEVQEAEEEVSRVEVVNEDGTIEEIGADEELQQEDWEDESVTEEDVWDATLMHLGEAVDTSAAIGNAGHDVLQEDEAEPVATEIQPTEVVSHEVVSHVAPEPEQQDEQPQEDVSTAQDVESTDAPAQIEPAAVTATQPKLAPQAPVLPAGFVSPVKERRRRPISQVKQAHANRRRTLPVNFAAQAAPAATSDNAGENCPEDEIEGIESAAADFAPEKLPSQDGLEEVIAAEPMEDTTHETNEPQDEKDSEHEWEDVEEDDVPENAASFRDMTPEPIEQTEWVDTVENTPTTPPRDQSGADQSLAAAVHERVADLVSPSKLPSSPVPSISGQHPRLPLRRSPRRQSTSPLKKSSTLPYSDRSHLIAFTPVKFPVYQSTTPEPKLASSPLPTSPALLQAGASAHMGLPQLTRSSSAPPEEPQMSPRKPGQPRLSDDTALLQAFINRASESKSGRRVSATARRESLENRRNSDTVRQALASPAAKPAVTDVLGDLDPNSPSPRKQAAVEVDAKSQQHDDQDELANSSPVKTASRRSGRAKKKPETLPSTTYSGPNKISIRGSADPVVLKKTEAQEIAQTTRANTKKNKGGAVLPPLRLTRMAKEAALNSGEEASEFAMEVERADRRGIKWAETLATFYEGANEPEISMMIDELSGPEPEFEAGSSNPDADMTGLPTPTPASETPSKPRQRRLKPTRTASTPAAGTRSGQNEMEVDPAEEAKPKATTRKRSRIATPAKPKGTANVSEPPKEEVKAEQKKTPAAKKKAVSKLPAPATSAIPAAQGKENSLIASPPKKRTKAPATPGPGNAPSAKVKLDFTKAAGLDKKQAESGNGAVPGIASPAKRSARTNVLFGEDGSVTKKELPPSLGSPAKKRTRRTAA